MVYEKNPSVLSEMFTCGKMLESFYDNHGFHLDMDHEGKIWCLKSSANHITRQ